LEKGRTAGTSLAAYPTARPVRRGAVGKAGYAARWPPTRLDIRLYIEGG